jgi:hypothetical protein
MENLIKIQSELKAPKSQFNKFGNYKYRNQDDILEAVKPLLLKYGCTLTITDTVEQIGQLTYINAIAKISDGKSIIEVNAQAGIDITQKGMSIAQCFGSSSSYARKYALNGMFLIDDTKEDDTTNTHKVVDKITPTHSEMYLKVSEHLKNCTSLEDITILWDSLENDEQKECKALFTKRRLEIENSIK